MTVVKLAPGERAKHAERHAKSEKAKYARLRAVQAEWEERQAAQVRCQQAALKAQCLARRPDWAA